MWYLTKESIKLISWRVLFKIMPVFLLVLYKEYLNACMKNYKGLTYNQKLRLAILMDILENGVPYFPWLKRHKGKYL